ncbi:MAG: mechanosensitive ion channel family protein [Cyclobacteriaceae bacterium]
MQTFFQEYAREIIWLLSVAGGTLILVFLTKRLFTFLTTQAQKYGRGEPRTFKLLQKITTVFLYIVGVGLASYVFLNESMHEAISRNLQKIIWLTIVAIITIGLAASVKLIFDRFIKQAYLVEGKDPTTYKFLRYIATAMIYVIGISLATYAFPQLQIIAKSALAGAGILAVVIGVASQEAIANVVGGIFIVFYKPFRVGDILKIRDDMVGEVEDITLRHTVIKNYQNKRIVVPNAIINKEKLINYDLGQRRTCQWIEVGISYDSDIDLAKKIMVEETMNHPNIIDNRTAVAMANGDPKVIVRVIGLGDSAVMLRAWAWAIDYPSAFVMKCELLESIKKRFDAEGIEIPFPHRTLVFKNQPDTLPKKVFSVNGIHE